MLSGLDVRVLLEELRPQYAPMVMAHCLCVGADPERE
jgi:hypothetical protein